MQIQKEKQNEAVTLKLDGRLDTVTAPGLEAAVNQLEDDVRHLVLDMGGVQYISSAGLRVLLGAQKKMNRTGSMKLIGVCESVMEILEMTGFSDILVIE